MSSEALKKSTYSMWAKFRNCRRMAYWRYVRELVPSRTKAPALVFGQLIHDCLECWHRDRSEVKMFQLIDEKLPLIESDPDQKDSWHKARSMMLNYCNTYRTEDFKVIDLERVFSVDIVNPDTGAKSRTFTLDGKVDGIVEREGKLCLLEHKTASFVDGGYLERLWCDFQIHLYAQALEKAGVGKIYGCIYNVLLKCKLEQKTGESEAEFEVRRDQLMAKSGKGTTTARRQMPEADEEFAARLDAWYSQPNRFHREIVIFDRSKWPELQAEIWELSKQWLDASRRKVWYQNTSQCFVFNRPCDYFPICRAGNNEITLNLYEHKPAHSELNVNEAAEPPVF